MFGTKDIWKLQGSYNEIDQFSFVRMVALFTMLSVGVVAAGVFISYTWQMSWVLLIATFIAMLIGAFMFAPEGTSAGISTVGVIIMSGAAGMMIGPMIASYSLMTVLQALIVTAGIVGIMSLVGIVFPKVFEGFGPYLLAALIVLLMAQFAQIFFIFLGFTAAQNLPILYWIGIGIFSLYVAYDWSRAVSLPHTVANAIKAAGAITLDIINIFIRVLGLMGKSDD